MLDEYSPLQRVGLRHPREMFRDPDYVRRHWRAADRRPGPGMAKPPAPQRARGLGVMPRGREGPGRYAARPFATRSDRRLANAEGSSGLSPSMMRAWSSRR